MQKELAEAANASKAVGPDSQAITVNGSMFLSGQLPIAPATRSFVSDDVCERTRRHFSNIAEALKATGYDTNNIIKVSVFLKDFRYFYKMNGVYATFFPSAFPPQSCVEAARLPQGANAEIETIALC